MVHYDNKAETAIRSRQGHCKINAEIQPLHRQIVITEAGCIKKPAWTCLLAGSPLFAPHNNME